MWRYVIVCLLAPSVLGGCANYALKQDVKKEFGEPELVHYVSGEYSGATLYGRSKPSGLGSIDREEWIYIYHHILVRFLDNRYEVQPLTVLQLLGWQQIQSELLRAEKPPPDEKRGKGPFLDPGVGWKQSGR